MGVLRSLRYLILFVGLAPVAPSLASASMQSEEDAIQAAALHGRTVPEDLALDGRGTLSWLGLKIYEAALWSESGDFPAVGFDQRIAFRIDYHRSIPAQRLVSATRKEWRRLDGQDGIPDLSNADSWLSQVGSMWPDVEPGDYILTVVEPGGPSRFYGRDGLLGVVQDPAFGPAFLSIWLHPGTSRPELRAALTGEATGGG